MAWMILASLALVFCLALLLRLLHRLLLLPVPLGRNTSLQLVLTVRGSVPELEQTVDALLWLRANHTLRGEICVRCLDVDRETKAAAELLQKHGLITLIYG